LTAQGTRTERWKVTAPSALCWAHWGDEWLLFDRRSNQTHLLTALAAGCLRLLGKNALNLDQLSDQLGAEFPSAQAELSSHHLDQMLRTLNEIGLITTVSQ
jgi:PqqD family protein of HPr-rel-A system